MRFYALDDVAQLMTSFYKLLSKFKNPMAKFLFAFFQNSTMTINHDVT